MFSGRWEQCLDHDAEGKVFLDFDPVCFQQILFCLRWRSIQSTPVANIPMPKLEAAKQVAYEDLVKYLAMEDFMSHCSSKPEPCLQSASTEFVGVRTALGYMPKGTGFRQA